MSVDISDLVPVLRRSVNPPGEDLFPDADDDEFAGYLSDAFWDARINGMLEDYTESEGSITPQSGTTDIPREEQQLIVIFAGINIITNTLRNLDTLFRAKGGNAEFEVQKSAQLLRDILKELQIRRNIVMDRLSDLGRPVDMFFDGIYERTESIAYEDTYWTL